MPTPEQAELQAKDQFTLGTKVFMALMWLIPGLIMGVVIRLFALPTEFIDWQHLLWQYLPWAGAGGALLAAFGWFFPNLSAWVLEVVLSIEISRS